jgi:tyrosyl-tRNA synthetase
MEAQDILAKLLSISENQELADSLKAKLAEKTGFTVVHPFEPNGRINIAQVMQYVIASKIVGECGGNYIVFIADVVASMNHAFGRDKTQLKQAVDYAIETLKAAGVDGPHVKYIISDDFTIDNFTLFSKFAEITTHIEASVVQKALPPMGKKERETLTASQVISPMMHLTELVEVGADVIIASAERVPLLSLVKYVKPENPPVIIPIRPIMKLKGVKSNPPKPDPKNTVFFEDDNDMLTKKFCGAFCTDNIADNPVYEYIKFLAMRFNGSFEFNGKKYEFGNDEFEKDFPTMEKKPLKEALAAVFIQLAEQVRPKITVKDIAKFTTAH